MVESQFNKFKEDNIKVMLVQETEGIATTSKGNVAVGPSRVMKCYNCQGEGHMARQYDLDAYDLDCDALSLAKAVLMANLSSCDLEVLSELDIEPISARLKNNRDAHEVYNEKTIEYADTFRGFVERARTQYPSEPLFESTCMFTKHVQELLVYTSQTCPNSPKPSEKLVAVTPSNKDKRVRFAEPVTSSNNIPKQTDSLKTKDSNKPLLTSIGVKPTTSASGSKPSGNINNNRITRPPRSNQKNKVEDNLRKVESSFE
ncbi:retrovirus-related pol polyprotein from transposon TNT 1-94 [Tanacetum coccineum]